MRVPYLPAAIAFCAALAGPAAADDIFLSFEGRKASQSVGPLRAADTLAIAGQVKRPAGPLAHTITLTPMVSSLTVDMTWRSGTSGDAVRLVGVNLDLVDSGGLVVASDLFQGTIAEFSSSSMTAAVTAGETYQLRLTGIAQGVAAYTIVVAPGS